MHVQAGAVIALLSGPSLPLAGPLSFLMATRNLYRALKITKMSVCLAAQPAFYSWGLCICGLLHHPGRLVSLADLDQSLR